MIMSTHLHRHAYQHLTNGGSTWGLYIMLYQLFSNSKSTVKTRPTDRPLGDGHAKFAAIPQGGGSGTKNSKPVPPVENLTAKTVPPPRGGDRPNFEPDITPTTDSGCTHYR